MYAPLHQKSIERNMQMKKIICCILCFFLLSCNIVAFAETLPTIRLVCDNVVNSEETFDVYVTVTENSNICGGRITIGYDKNNLEVLSATAENLLDGASLQQNLAYTESSIRVSWAGLTDITSGGNLLKVTFKAKTLYEDVSTAIFVQEMKFRALDENVISCVQEDASILIKAKPLPTFYVDCWQEVFTGASIEVKVNLSENSHACGGKFDLVYDNNMLEFVSAKQGALLSEATCFINSDIAPNKIRVSWAGTSKLLEGGPVLVVTFKALETPGETSLSFENQKVEANNVTIQNTAVGKSINIAKEIVRPPAITYSFGQSVQIGLIEPWFLKANARVYTEKHPTNIDYSSLLDYGAYFIRASELSDKNATQTSLIVEDIINNPASVKYSKADGTAGVDGSYITANYDKGLYTYEMADSIFVLFYVEDENGIQYAAIRERNIKSLLETRKNDTVNFKNVLERNVYSAMDELEANVGVYRAQFDKIEELQEQKAPTLAEYVAENGNFENETVKSYTFGNSVQLILVEPWGLKVNARVYNSANPNNINYNSVEEYGAIVYYDTEGTITSMTAEALRIKNDAYVFSSKNNDASVDGSYITALYNKGIYTYQLDSNAYVMFYIKDSNGYHYGDVKVRNAYELAKTRGQDNSGNFGEAEKTVYQNMVKMYDAIKAYRDDYFYKN